MDFKKMKINYEKQELDNFNINSYEIVIAVSKKAREINEKTQKYLKSGIYIKPITMALKKLENDKVKFEYSNEESSPSEDSSIKES